MPTPPRLSRRERLESDLRMLRTSAKLAGAAKHRASSTTTVADKWEAVVDKHPHKVAMIDASDDGREVTYLELDQMANRVAHWAKANELARGDVVALLMMNRPEYVATWLGLAKLGITSALINTNLTGEPLRHSIDVSGARHIVVDEELADHWQAVRGKEHPVELGFAPGWEEMAEHSTSRPKAGEREGLTCGDRLLYIYTSGTTGLPKAASFSHSKYLTVSLASAAMMNLDQKDRTYITLPLYHTAGGVMALGGALLTGATAVTVRKFSASRFWDDCVQHGATTFQYIGELCRYLVNTPSHPLERAHGLRVALGNGLRPDVWPDFQERFGIPDIVEFYGATEGTGSLINLDNRVGAIGRMRPQVARRLGMHIVKYDVDADEIVRDGDGRVIDVGPNEAGEFISRISNLTPFEGYQDEEATEKKILRGAFSDGDAYFRSGDLLSQDEDGYYYFVDRIGDTFRWKGENVSTAEVAAVLGKATGVLEANVYGVTVPGADGRAGMATLVVDDSFTTEALAGESAENLPAYARPLFLRLQSEVEITGTFKHRKIDSVKEGFDPAAIDDPLWFFDSDEKAYVPLDPPLFARITTGDVRL